VGKNLHSICHLQSFKLARKLHENLLQGIKVCLQQVIDLEGPYEIKPEFLPRANLQLVPYLQEILAD
jgi:hypothetical protein